MFLALMGDVSVQPPKASLVSSVWVGPLGLLWGPWALQGEAALL